MVYYSLLGIFDIGRGGGVEYQGEGITLGSREGVGGKRLSRFRVQEFKSSGLQVVRCKVYMWLQDLNFVAQGSGVLLLKQGLL